MSINNVDKIMSYITPVSVSACDHLYLNESLFYKDGCVVCGKCCIHEDLIFLPFEVDNMRSVIAHDSKIPKEHLGGTVQNISDLVESLVPLTVNVQGKEKLLYKSKLPYNTYEFDDRGTLNRCHWNIPVGNDMLGCGIHLVSSLTCKFPHVRLNYSKERKTTHIGLMQYGRNWALKCPIVFDETFYPQTVLNVIQKFELLNRYCEYFEIANHCDKILNTLVQVKTVYDVKKVCNIDLLQRSNKKRLF